MRQRWTWSSYFPYVAVYKVILSGRGHIVTNEAIKVIIIITIKCERTNIESLCHILFFIFLLSSSEYHDDDDDVDASAQKFSLIFHFLLNECSKSENLNCSGHFELFGFSIYLRTLNILHPPFSLFVFRISFVLFFCLSLRLHLRKSPAKPKIDEMKLSATDEEKNRNKDEQNERDLLFLLRNRRRNT